MISFVRFVRSSKPVTRILLMHTFFNMMSITLSPSVEYLTSLSTGWQFMVSLSGTSSLCDHFLNKAILLSLLVTSDFLPPLVHSFCNCYSDWVWLAYMLSGVYCWIFFVIIGENHKRSALFVKLPICLNIKEQFAMSVR